MNIRDRARNMLAAINAAPESTPPEGDVLAEPVAETTPEPEPPRREHLYGSTYRVRMSFDELMATRGYTGEQVLNQRRRIARSNDAQRQRNDALNRAGYRVGEVLFPPD